MDDIEGEFMCVKADLDKSLRIFKRDGDTTHFRKGTRKRLREAIETLKWVRQRLKTSDTVS